MYRQLLYCHSLLTSQALRFNSAVGFLGAYGSLARDNDEETPAFHTRKDIVTEDLEESEKLRSSSPEKFHAYKNP
jgi:hypothetical protein